MKQGCERESSLEEGESESFLSRYMYSTLTDLLTLSAHNRSPLKRWGSGRRGTR